MSNLIINSLQVQLNQTIENIQAHQHLIILARLGSQVRRTQVWSGDKFQGQWNDDIRLNRTTEDSLEIRLSALETPQSSSGQLLGVAKISFSQIQASNVLQEWFPLIIKEQEAGQVYAKIQYLGDSQINLGTPSHHTLAGMPQVEQRTPYTQYQTQSPTFASSNQLPSGSGFTQYTSSLQQPQQQQQQQVVQSQATNLPQGYQIYQGSPSQVQGQNLVSPQSQIYVQNVQGLPSQDQIIQQIQNRFQQHQVPQSQYPPRQVVQIPQQQQQQQQQTFQFAQQNPPQPPTFQQFQQLQLQKASYQQQPQVILAQNQLGQQIQYVQQPQIQGYQQQQQQYAPQLAQQQQVNKYRVNSVSTVQPRQLISGVERQSSSQIRLLPYDQAQQQQIQGDEMQGLVNAFDNQLIIANPPAVVGLPQQQTDFISQQPLMQSVVRLVPSGQYQEQLQQSPPQQVVHISGQPHIQEFQQPQYQGLSNSQLRLVPMSQLQHQQQQQLIQQQQPAQGITLLGRQNVSQQQHIQQQVSPVGVQVPGQTLSNSQIRIIPLNQAQQLSGVQQQQQQQQQILSYQPQQQLAYNPQVQYVNQQGLPQQGYAIQQGTVYQQQQQFTPGVQLISSPYGQLQYQQ